jgi:hypothetical protein
MPTTKSIPVDNLEVDPFQSREQAWTGDETDVQLANAIEKEGLMQDLIVRPSDGHASSEADYTIIAGSRRFEAAIRTGKDEVRCKIIEVDDVDAGFKSLHENEARKELSERELSQALWQLRELITEERISCPACGKNFEEESTLGNHIQRTECEYDTGGDAAVATSEPPFTNNSDAVRYITNRLYGKETHPKKVKRLIRNTELPEELQALLKDPKQRTAQEQTTLENFSIDPTISYQAEEGGNSDFSNELLRLHRQFNEKLDSESIDPTKKVLETVGRLDVGDEMSKTDVTVELIQFRQTIADDLTAADSPAEQRGLIDAELERREERLREHFVEMDREVPFKSIEFQLDGQSYTRYHEIAKQERGFSSHSETVRELYQERLEKLAEENGW